ncbi:MAG: alpha/beta hydrolase [Bacteroidota bacterium]
MKTQHLEFPARHLRLQYVDHGSGPRTLLFLHGWCINLSYWQAQIDHFRTDYRVVAVDLPGFGASRVERSTWSIEAMATDLKQLIEALDLTQVVIVGHSMSGELGLETALQAGDRVVGLVGVDNFKFVGMEVPADLQEIYSGIVSRFTTDFPNAAQELADRFFFHPATPVAVRERIHQAYRSADPAVAVPIFYALLHYSTSVPEKLAQLPFPLHLIGSDTPPPYLPVLEQQLRHGVYVSLMPETGHYPMIEQPVAFNAALQQIMTQ